MKIKAHGLDSAHVHIPITARCPHCRSEAVLEPLGKHDYSPGEHSSICGQRRCPNPECHGHVFVVIRDGKLVRAYPAIRLDFDPTNIPARVLRTFEEAITCHASDCFVAAAIMVRGTLEELCEDRGASGKDLKARISDLRAKIVIPAELLDAMDELRILGNDAAHLEARDYDAVTETEVSVALEFTKEILKSLFQYSSLLNKLRSLKKQP